MNQETREHITKDKTYEKAISFGEKIGIRKTYEGGNKDTTWESTLSILPVGVENPNDLWINEREVIDSLFESMEYFLCVIHKGNLLEREDIYLSLYSRYMDDIIIITDVINKEDKGRIIMRLKAELENLDPVGKSIKVTGKEVYMDNIVEERGGTEEQGMEYLDI